MHIDRHLTAPSDRTTKRLIVGSILVLAIGIPLDRGALCLFDQYRTPGPSLVERDIAGRRGGGHEEPEPADRPPGPCAGVREERPVRRRGRAVRPDPDRRARRRSGAARPRQRLHRARPPRRRRPPTSQDRRRRQGRRDGQRRSPARVGLLRPRRRSSSSRTEPKEAVVQLANAIQIKRTDADALNLLGTALLQAGEPQRAVDRHTPGDRARAHRLVRPVRPARDRAIRPLGDGDGAGYAAGMRRPLRRPARRREGEARRCTTGTYAVDALVGLGLVAEVRERHRGRGRRLRQGRDGDPPNFAAVTGLGRVGGCAIRQPGASPRPAARREVADVTNESIAPAARRG